MKRFDIYAHFTKVYLLYPHFTPALATIGYNQVLRYNKPMKKNSALSKAVMGLSIFLGVFILTAIFNFKLFLILVNVLWLTIFTLTVIFIVLGILTFLGRKKEANQIIDMFLEGSLTLIDIGNFIRETIKTFLELVVDFLMLVIPNLSYILAGALFVLILLIYKVVGVNNDVTIMTVSLAFGLTIVSGLLTLPKPQTNDIAKKPTKMALTMASFKRKFVDSFEVVIFVLFLTIDSTHLFFLPKELNVPIEAHLWGYDLMIRGIDVLHAFSFTVLLILLGIAIELFRQAIRLIAVAVNFYRNPKYIPFDPSDPKNVGESLLKKVVIKTVQVSKDDFLMFAAFTVFITFVFLLFPRLKLIALISASLAGLILDLAFRQRLVSQEKEDLLNRVFQKVVGNSIKGDEDEDVLDDSDEPEFLKPLDTQILLPMEEKSSAITAEGQEFSNDYGQKDKPEKYTIEKDAPKTKLSSASNSASIKSKAILKTEANAAKTSTHEPAVNEDASKQDDSENIHQSPDVSTEIEEESYYYEEEITIRFE